MSIRVMTEEQRLFFETNGYLVIPNALSPEDLNLPDRVRRKIRKLLPRTLGAPGLRNRKQFTTTFPNYRLILWNLYDALRDFRKH